MYVFAGSVLAVRGFLNISWKPCRDTACVEYNYWQLNHVNIQPTDAFCLSLVDSITLVSWRKNTSPFQMRLSFLDCPLLLFLEQKMNIDWQDLP